MPSDSRDEIKTIVAGLKKSSLLSGLTDRQMKRLAAYAKLRRLPKDSLVVKRGDKGIGFYVVLDGQVQVRKESTILAKLGPGDFFGELALFDDKVRSADVVALEPTTVVTLSRWEFWGFASGHPEVLRTILTEMARRIPEAERIPD